MDGPHPRPARRWHSRSYVSRRSADSAVPPAAKVIKVCRETKEFWLNAEYLNLGPRERLVMLTLTHHPGQRASEEALCNCFDCPYPRAAMHRTISRLRHLHLGGKNAISNAPGRGYLLTLPVERLPYEPPDLTI